MQVIRSCGTAADRALSKETAQVFIQQYGFLVMFISGVGSRAVPTFTGLTPRALASRLAALILRWASRCSPARCCGSRIGVLEYRSAGRRRRPAADGGRVRDVGVAIGRAVAVEKSRRSRVADGVLARAIGVRVAARRSGADGVVRRSRVPGRQLAGYVRTGCHPPHPDDRRADDDDRRHVAAHRAGVRRPAPAASGRTLADIGR